VAVAARRVGEQADVTIDGRRHHPFEKNPTGRISSDRPRARSAEDPQLTNRRESHS
jgi:hypothetical protein